jgi:cullin 4
MKKLVIKPLRSRPQLPEDFETSNWNRLRDAVIAVQNSSPTPYALEELFRAVEDLCLHGAAPALFTRLRELSDTHAAQVVASLAQRVTLEAISFLPYVVRTWQAYCSQQLLTRQIFLYLDRTYVLNAAPVRSIFDLGLELFLLHWDKYPEVEKRSVEGLISLIDAERAGEAVDRDLLRELLRMLSNLGIYEKAFQLRFLKQAATWYAAEGIRMVQVSRKRLPLAMSCCVSILLYWEFSKHWHP